MSHSYYAAFYGGCAVIGAAGIEIPDSHHSMGLVFNKILYDEGLDVELSAVLHDSPRR